MLRLLAWLPLLVLSVFAADKPAAYSTEKFDKDIAAFEAADKANPPADPACKLKM